MRLSFWKWLDSKVEMENEWIKEEYGISYYFCPDSICDDFVDSGAITVEQFEEDDLEILRPIFEEWSKTAKPLIATQKDIDAYIKEHKAEVRMRAMESGYHNFVDDGERTYYW